APIKFPGPIIPDMQCLDSAFGPESDKIRQTPYHIRVGEMRVGGFDWYIPEGAALLGAEASIQNESRLHLLTPFGRPSRPGRVIGPSRQNHRDRRLHIRSLRPGKLLEPVSRAFR